MSGLFGLLPIAAVIVLVGVLIGRARIPAGMRLLLLVAVGLRLVGAYARQTMAADAHVYYAWGVSYASYFAKLDFSPIFDPQLWRSSQWIGTNFVAYPTGLLAVVLGESWLALFFAFGLIAFGGAVALAAAFRRSFPGAPYRGYWGWLFLLPSLWFWPASIGKEALILAGLGVATLGFAGRRGRPSWALTAAGLALVFCVRPQIVAVFLVAVVLSYWLDFRAWSPARLLQGVAILAVGLLGIWYALATTLQGDVDLQTMEEYVAENAASNQFGGSAIEGVGADVGGAHLAAVNVLFRPFPWETHNLTSRLAALELLLIWCLVWFRRRELKLSLKLWQRHRMLRFAVPFVVLYVIALGMNLSNLGLLARQRVLVFPLLFLVVEAGVYFARGTVRSRAPRRRRAPARVRRPLLESDIGGCRG